MIIAIIECFGVGIVVVVGAVAQILILYGKGKVTRGGAVYLGSSLVWSRKNHCIYIYIRRKQTLVAVTCTNFKYLFPTITT